jgi:hypothetical protein
VAPRNKALYSNLPSFLLPKLRHSKCSAVLLCNTTVFLLTLVLATCRGFRLSVKLASCGSVLNMLKQSAFMKSADLQHQPNPLHKTNHLHCLLPLFYCAVLQCFVARLLEACLTLVLATCRGFLLRVKLVSPVSAVTASTLLILFPAASNTRSGAPCKLCASAASPWLHRPAVLACSEVRLVRACSCCRVTAANLMLPERLRVSRRCRDAQRLERPVSLILHGQQWTRIAIAGCGQQQLSMA